jgi:acetyl esterase/lipase
MTYTYKQAGELKILADVYPAAGEKRPVVIWIHGGALIMGYRKGVPAWLLEASRKNEYVLVSIDYRLAPGNAIATDNRGCGRCISLDT